MNTVEKNVNSTKIALWAPLVVSCVLLACLLLWPEFRIPEWSMPIFYILIAGMMIFNYYYWRKGSAWPLIIAGMMINMGLTRVMDDYLPLFVKHFVKHIDLAFEWYQFIGLGGFMLLVGGIALAMRWALDKW
jgi:membrane protease YdiL (CAAX protease family)